MLLVNISIFYFHVTMVYFIFISTLVTNDISTLVVLLLLMCIIKCGFFFFDRCILSVLEDNEYINTFSLMSLFTQSDKLTDMEMEEIMINIGMLMLLNKILVLLWFDVRGIEM